MVRTILARIDDMIEAIDEIRRATADMSFEQFQRDWVLRKATERGIEIISGSKPAPSRRAEVPASLCAMAPRRRHRQRATPRVSSSRGANRVDGGAG
jgi:ribonuclease HepT-like protein